MLEAKSDPKALIPCRYYRTDDVGMGTRCTLWCYTVSSPLVCLSPLCGRASFLAGRDAMPNSPPHLHSSSGLQTNQYRIEDTIKDLLGPLLYHWTRIRPVLPTANNPSIPQLGDSFNTVNITLRRSSTLLVCPIEGTAADGKNMYEWCWCFVSRHGTVNGPVRASNSPLHRYAPL